MNGDPGRTLADRLRAFDDGFSLTVTIQNSGAFDAKEVYGRSFHRTFGFSVSDIALRRDGPLISRVAILCTNKGYDFPTYVMANMRILKSFIERMREEGNKRFSFRPTMLLGPKAESRYLSQLKDQQDKYHVVTDNADKESYYNRARLAMLFIERRVGERVVLSHRLGTPMSEADAARSVSQLGAWEIHGRPYVPVKYQTVPDEVYARMKVWARLRAAADIVDGITVREGGEKASESLVVPKETFTWTELGEFLAELYPFSPRKRRVLTHS